MDMLKRWFGRGRATDAKAATTDADDELFERRHEDYKWFEMVDENPLDYVEPFPFLRLREDLRRHVLGFALEASWSGIQREKPAMEWNPETKAFDQPPHLLFSASAAVRTLTYHTRTIKAVCTAVCSDVRLLEKTTVHPRAWLEGLWHKEVVVGTRTVQLRECRERALVAGRPNFASEMYSRLETRGGGGEPVVKCPATWPKKRAAGAEHLFENYQESDGSWDDGDHSLAWAHVRTRTAEQEHGLAPIDNEYLATIGRTTFMGFVCRFVQHTWTLKVSKVSIVYRGDWVTNADGSRVRMRGNAEDVDALETGLVEFFGAAQMKNEPWVQAWCNSSDYPFDANRAETYPTWKHDPTRPPVTRLRDVKDRQGRASPDVTLTTGQSSLAAATFDVSFLHSAVTSEQENGSHEDDEDATTPKPPVYHFIGPVSYAKCRSGSGTYSSGITFKIRTEDFSERNQSLEDAIVMIPVVPDVFDAICTCSIVGLS